MIPMNFMKSKAGFTLVELIVVIAILGILAGIAVPAYSGYIKKAESAADLQVLSTINTAVQGLVAAEGSEVAEIKVTETKVDDATALDKGQGTITVTVAAKDNTVSVTDTEVQELTGVLKDMFRAEFKGATWKNGEWKLGEPAA